MSSCWMFTTPTVDEAPFAWNPLMERYRIARAVSIVEVSHGVYKQVRYDSYTNEIGAANLPPNPNEQDTDFWPAPATGLHYFRGGYEWQVDDATKNNIIASGVADASNFVPCAGDGGYGSGGFGGGGFG